MFNEIIIFVKLVNIKYIKFVTNICNRTGSTTRPGKRQWQVPMQNKFEKSSDVDHGCSVHRFVPASNANQCQFFYISTFICFLTKSLLKLVLLTEIST